MSVPAAYFGIILIWSTTPLAIQWSAQGAGFSFAVFARMLIGLAVCLALLAATRTAVPWHPAARRLYAVSGLTLCASMLLTYWGALHIPSGLISVIFGMMPLVTGGFAALWLSERTLTPARIAGLGLALVGLWLIFGQPWPGEGRATLGTAAVVGGMVVQALGLVWIKRLSVPISSLAITCGSLGVAVPGFALVWLFADGGQPPAGLEIRVLLLDCLLKSGRAERARAEFNALFAKHGLQPLWQRLPRAALSALLKRLDEKDWFAKFSMLLKNQDGAEFRRELPYSGFPDLNRLFQAEFAYQKRDFALARRLLKNRELQNGRIKAFLAALAAKIKGLSFS